VCCPVFQRADFAVQEFPKPLRAEATLDRKKLQPGWEENLDRLVVTSKLL
jgi:hypothetical protein